MKAKIVDFGRKLYLIILKILMQDLSLNKFMKSILEPVKL